MRHPRGDLGPGAQPQLPQDLADVRLDGAFVYRQFPGDLAVGVPAPDEGRHLPLAPGEEI
jgi:hypothetical protein